MPDPTTVSPFPFRVSANRIEAHCGIKIHCHPNELAVVVVTELPDNPGMSICNAFEDLLPRICCHFQLNPRQIEYFEYWEKWDVAKGHPYNRDREEWHRVSFDVDFYHSDDRPAPNELDPRRLREFVRVSGPKWSPTTRKAIEARIAAMSASN